MQPRSMMRQHWPAGPVHGPTASEEPANSMTSGHRFAASKRRLTCVVPVAAVLRVWPAVIVEKVR